YVAISVCSLMISTCILLEISVPLFAIGILFLGTILSYYFTKQGNFNIYSTWWILCIIASLFCFFPLQKNSKIIVIINSILSVFYILPIPKKNLRSLAFLKIFIVAFCWVLGSVWLPTCEEKYSINSYTYWLSIQYFLWVIVLILPFDIRDKRYDAPKLTTFPTQFGIIFTKYLGISLILIFLIISFCINSRNFIWYSQLISAIATILLLWFSKEKQSPYYCSFWVESVPIFYLILLIFLK
ncbi:MAG: hypothetical protein Q3983_09380, partial [Capnocytophaga sp.]|nr:hypothetical protein [Capnocytophaga sp.]